MKIRGTGEAPPPTRTRKSEKSKPAFALNRSAPADASSASKTSALSAPATLSALIALQTRQDAGKKTIAAAQRVLDALDGLHLKLLNGEASTDDLDALASAAQLRAHSGADAALLDIYDEITLRARVELAKLGR